MSPHQNHDNAVCEYLTGGRHDDRQASDRLFATRLTVLQKTKEFLSQKGITFQERDVSQDPSALGELERMELMTTPVTVIDGEAVVGFDTAKLRELLDLP